MKKILLPLLFLSTGICNAQNKEGKVIYERTMQMRRPQNMDPDMAARIPASRTDNYELLFANNQSLWRSLPKADGDNGSFGGGGRMFVMAGNDDIIYYNFTDGKRIDKKELFDNQFIVLDSISKLQWKLSDETKTLLTHSVHKATAQRYSSRMQMTMENGQMKREKMPDTSTIVAWYTTDFPVAVGPEAFQGQLPGVVLELNVNNGKLVYRAVEISPKVAVKEVKEPKGGKKLTPAEFEKESDRLMEEMRKNMPQGSSIRISN